ncbi:hypothetical protein ACIG5C_15535 [Streptomyces werraensis]|uniref:hypothetical protein n=1 Tax=Streptomyces werraensis TaxID=68284 RepID=UPI0037D3FB18
MSTTGNEWLGDTSATDAAFIVEAPGGALSALGRQAAVEASLPLLSVYFASGKQQELRELAAIAVSAQEPELDIIQAGLRLRVALAAGQRLAALLDSITRRPTFRYELNSAEHVGSLSGTLDVNRWITKQRGGDQDAIFPVLEVRRGARTAENVLASYAALWLLGELKASFNASLATRDTVEYRAVRVLRERLGRLVQSPTLAVCIREAQAVRTQSALERLLGQVKHRLRRREIAHPTPYRDLVEWIDHCLQGRPVVSAGDIDLSVYDARFDNKLFELWCLKTLSQRLAVAVNVPDPIVDPRWRKSAPAYQFATFSGRVELFFQRTVAAVDKRHAATWRMDDGRLLGGIPDIVVRGTTTSGATRLAVIDPKLRQRVRLPAEELYKILGYLQNFDIRPAVGVVLVYTTDTEVVKPNVFHDGAGGTLISASVNPAASEAVTAAALEEVVKAVLKLIEYNLPAWASAASIDGLSEEEAAERKITDFRRELAAWGQGQPNEIRPSRERIRTLIGEDRWHSLEGDVQTMVATADFIGYQLEVIDDFSGPVIGICAAIEHILYEAVVSPVIAENSNWQRQARTFGAAIDVVENACLGQGGPFPREVRQHMQSLQLDLAQVQALVPVWRRLNRNFRVPAAHRKVLNQSEWQQLYRLVLGSEALFAKTYDVLNSPSRGEQ